LRKLLYGLLFLPAFCLSAGAQGIPDSSSVVTACGSISPLAPPYTPGQVRSNTIDQNGNGCTNTSVNVNVPNPLPVTVTGTASVSGTVTANPQTTTTTGASGTVTIGGTFQTVAASNPSRLSLDVENICNVSGKCNSTFDFCYLSFDASPTTSNAIPIPPGGSYLRSSGVIPSDAVKITCDATGDKFRAAIQ